MPWRKENKEKTPDLDSVNRTVAALRPDGHAVVELDTGGAAQSQHQTHAVAESYAVGQQLGVGPHVLAYSNTNHSVNARK